jgi:hypothetical protein
MSRKSKNNRRKTAGKITTNPTQYIQFKNYDKYSGVVDGMFLYIINNITQEKKAIFNYNELLDYLKNNNIALDINLKKKVNCFSLGLLICLCDDRCI